MSLPKREPALARGRGTAVVVFMVKDEDVSFIRRRHDVADAARNEAGCSS
jgi:hypothetical protein